MRPYRQTKPKQDSHGQLAVLYEDDDIILVDKPAGLPSANAPRGADSLFTRLTHRFGTGAFVGVVSRLDQPVSGVVIFAKTPSAAASLAEQFRERTVTKEYLALVEKRFPAALNEWVAWQDHLRWDEATRRAVVGGRQAPQSQGAEFALADTLARVIRRAGEVSLVELRPQTGRRHQLRAQLATHGCPIVGDRLYGGRLPLETGPGQGIGLHASRLTFLHPRTGDSQSFFASIPGSWRSRFPQLIPPPARK
jgi:23S rRNA pseudouridine1911/1915/1917 synthase